MNSIVTDSTASLPGSRRPEVLLLLMAAAVPLSFATWMALLDNFSIHQAGFSGREIGILQSLREVPGFLAFALLWLISPAAVFPCGAAMAGISLLLAVNVPQHPEPGNEAVMGRVTPVPVSA